MVGSPAWELFAQCLRPLGLGYPLWCPEPSLESGEIRLGDVGFIRDGTFICLFNTLHSADDEVNRQGVPEGFQPLDHPHLVMSESQVEQLVFHSRGIQSVDVAVATSDDTSPEVTLVNTSSDLQFRCTAKTGALMLLGSPAVVQEIISRRRVVHYIQSHLDTWLEYANSVLGLDLKEQDLVFISGTTKTSSWANIVFQKSTESGSLKIQGADARELLPLSSGQFHVSMVDATDAMVFARMGPANAAQVGSLPANQCVFIHYYRMKRRLLLQRVMQAAAGPHQLYIHKDGNPLCQPSEAMNCSGCAKKLLVISRVILMKPQPRRTSVDDATTSTTLCHGESWTTSSRESLLPNLSDALHMDPTALIPRSARPISEELTSRNCKYFPSTPTSGNLPKAAVSGGGALDMNTYALLSAWFSVNYKASPNLKQGSVGSPEDVCVYLSTTPQPLEPQLVTVHATVAAEVA